MSSSWLGATSRTQRRVVRAVAIGLALLALTLGLVDRLAYQSSGPPVGTVGAEPPGAPTPASSSSHSNAEGSNQ